jgi:hypothetical protein
MYTHDLFAFYQIIRELNDSGIDGVCSCAVSTSSLASALTWKKKNQVWKQFFFYDEFIGTVIY